MPVTQQNEGNLVAWINEFGGQGHIEVHWSHYRADGRVVVTRDGLRVYLHRQLYKRCIGPLDPGDFLLRSCDAKECLNPWHYSVARQPVGFWERTQCPNGHEYSERDWPTKSQRCYTCWANHLKGGMPHWQQEKRRKFCPQGHEYTPENTYSYPTPSGGVHRKCKTCTKERALANRG